MNEVLSCFVRVDDVSNVVNTQFDIETVTDLRSNRVAPDFIATNRSNQDEKLRNQEKKLADKEEEKSIFEKILSVPPLSYITTIWEINDGALLINYDPGSLDCHDHRNTSITKGFWSIVNNFLYYAIGLFIIINILTTSLGKLGT